MTSVDLVAEASNVTKSFGPTRALRGATVQVTNGAAHGLVGRNGAGKSTIVSLLTGLETPDSGLISLAGRPAPAPGDRKAWKDLVACVYQRSRLVPTLTVAENVGLNSYPRSRWRGISWNTLRDNARNTLQEWNLDLDVDAPVDSLPVDQRKIVEIARALAEGTRFIILDEPTAYLEKAGVRRLFEAIELLKQRSITFLYISHHLEEVFEICTEVTVLRDGQSVMSTAVEDVDETQLVNAMVGAQRVIPVRRSSARDDTPSRLDDVVPALTVESLSDKLHFRDISFVVQPGERVGLAGLSGSGAFSIATALAGLIPRTGRVEIDGSTLPPNRVDLAIKMGLGLVPRDRLTSGFIPAMSIEENITSALLPRLGPWGFISYSRRKAKAQQVATDLAVVASSVEQPVGELSGGNQQKVVLGRALASSPSVLVMSSPTAGVDIASRELLFEKIQAAQCAVLLVSDDVEELAICDRVLIVFRGQITHEFGHDWSTPELVSAIEGVGK